MMDKPVGQITPDQVAIGPVKAAIAGMLAMTAGMGIARFAYTPILPDMARDLGLTPVELGLIASGNFMGYLVGAFIVWRTPIRKHACKLVLWSLLAGIALLAMMALPLDLNALIAVRLLAGVSSAFVMIVSTALVVERFQIFGRPQLIAAHFGGVGVGIAASAILIGVLAQFEATQATHWIACAVLSLVMMPLIWLWLPGHRVEDAPSTGSKSVHYSPPFLMVLVAYSLFGFGYIISATFLVAIVRDTPQIAQLEPFVWVVVGLAVIVSNWFWQAFFPRIGVFNTLALAHLSLGIGVAATVLWQTPAGIFAGSIMLGLSISAIASMALTAGRMLSDTDPRAVFGILTAGFGLGQIVGPTFAGYLAEGTGDFTQASLIAAASQLVAALLIKLAWHNRKRIAGVTNKRP